MTSPVQVLVIGFDDPHFSGEALGELTRLREAGIVRLVDLLLVERQVDGSLHSLPAPDALGPDIGAIVTSLLSTEADDSTAVRSEQGRDWWSLEDAVPPGSIAVVALIEHLWAGPLVDAVRQAGGQTLEETWLAPGDLSRLGDVRTGS